ncbi:6715_t:CDS:1 [Cetraspora pellucida]|uniref:6715_t:CDS:1 n=1 Tax=Cetraspora pellucida TaxID=1433469 RepID=A0ACA9KEA5_9GLOM|nr:6715_t:CDS:1 [Cetraspora pellucida]
MDIENSLAPFVVTAIAVFALVTPFLASTPKSKSSKNKKKSASEDRKTNNNYVYGLFNQGNNICFLNAVLQSLASLKNLRTYLRKKLESTTNHDERLVTFALYTTLEKLNEPLTSQDSFNPTSIVWALQAANIKRLINRQQQDAHELFQLLSESLSVEDEISRRPKSLFDVDTIKLLANNNSNIPISLASGRNPLIGLTACRISCMKCGYCGPIRHSSFDNISIPLPKQNIVTLETLLKTYSGIEFIDEYNCPQCSLLETLAIIEKRLAISDKKYLNKLKADKQIVKEALATDVDIDDSKLKFEVAQLVRMNLPATKQTMFAKLPEIMALHFSRSIYLQNGMTLKNSCRVIFPEFIDLAQYTTTGYLATMPSEPLSSPPTSPTTSSPVLSPILAEINDARHVGEAFATDASIYRLKSVIVHLGDHRLGHFVTYRRQEGASNAWWRISDENVEEVSLAKVLEQEAYMLFYEKGQN